MNEDPLEYSEYLDLMPDYRAGRLSPVQAHRIANLLADDPIFRKEAKRDELIALAVSSIPLETAPRELVERSLAAATGGGSKTGWFSFDTILIALGVGVAGAGATQFLTNQVDVFGTFGAWIGSLTGLAVKGGIETILGAVVLGTVGALGAVGVWAVRLLRSE
ncbi:MAG: hypothetical protein MAG453_00684 [Calditrichaeota bacterium]|nr:hypothetical protein [Calditrichota bacterium]